MRRSCVEVTSASRYLQGFSASHRPGSTSSTRPEAVALDVYDLHRSGLALVSSVKAGFKLTMQVTFDFNLASDTATLP
jgi:hypothetical protein